jgi:hypothetical protein
LIIIRDSRKNIEYFQSYFEEHQPRLQKFLAAFEAATDDPLRRFRASTVSFNIALNIAVARYSSGEELEDVASAFKYSLKLLGNLVSSAKPVIDFVRSEYAGGYDERYRLLAMCLSLGIDREEVSTAIEYIDLFKEGDLIWSIFARHLGYTPATSSQSLIWPSAYAELAQALSSPPATATTHLRAFLDSWYANMAITSWHDSHRRDTQVYVGYWCFEAAAAVKILNLDRRDFEHNPFYPRDLPI